jgi:hypothetical protein
MNYKKIYDSICERGLTIREGMYLERHRIIPGCMGGKYVDGNISYLTGREHYIAHWLLYKIEPKNRKLAYAFNNMCRIGKNQQRNISSRAFAAAKKAFSDNHPMKDPEIKEKMRQKKLELARSKREAAADARPRCVCGNKIYRSASDFCSRKCWGENRDMSYVTDDYKAKLSLARKKFLSNLTEKEEKKRLATNLHSDKVDHVKRGKAISRAKKGKKTNQVEIMGRRFAAMSDEEFEKYLTTIKWRSCNRMISYRNRYIKINE